VGAAQQDAVVGRAFHHVLRFAITARGHLHVRTRLRYQRRDASVRSSVRTPLYRISSLVGSWVVNSRRLARSASYCRASVATAHAPGRAHAPER
jgi:hypothetical protein